MGSSVCVEWRLRTFFASANRNHVAATSIQRGVVPFVGTAPLQVGPIPIPSGTEDSRHGAFFGNGAPVGGRTDELVFGIELPHSTPEIAPGILVVLCAVPTSGIRPSGLSPVQTTR